MIRHRHAEYFLALAETAQPKLPTEEGAVWLNRLETEIDNVRALVEWSLGPDGHVELGIRLAEALLWFWMIRGHIREGRAHLATLLVKTPESTDLRARALHASGWLALHHGDLDVALAPLEASLALRRELDDRPGIALTLEGLGLAAHGLGEPGRAAALLEESLALWQELGGPQKTDLRANLAEVVRDLGDFQRATTLHEENLAEYRERGHRHGELVSLRGLGHLARIQGRYARSAALVEEGLILVLELQDARCAHVCLDELACLAALQGWAARAARLFGAAEHVREAGGFSLPRDRADYDACVGLVRAALSEEAYIAGGATGRAMSLEQAIEYALSPADREPSGSARVLNAAQGGPGRSVRGGAVLTRREREVAALVARGLTDPQIAETLVIGRRTAETHVAHCLNKLGLATRTQLATWAVEHGLATLRPG